MLWNLIYEFFVKYIFGGCILENGYYVNYKGIFSILDLGGGLYGSSYTSDVYFDLFGQSIVLGDYFALISTIITIVIILLVIGHFIKKAFNLFGRII